jgi:hypothetical protein
MLASTDSRLYARFTAVRPAVGERLAAGKALRQQLARRQHGAFALPATQDPVAILEAQASTRGDYWALGVGAMQNLNKNSGACCCCSPVLLVLVAVLLVTGTGCRMALPERKIEAKVHTQQGYYRHPEQ